MRYCDSLTCFQYAVEGGESCASCQAEAQVVWWDPHFHIWTLIAGKDGKTVSGHDAAALSGGFDQPLYDQTHYEADMEVKGFKHTGGAFVEAISCCFPDKAASEMDFLMERDWVWEHLSQSSRVYVMVCGASLEAPNVSEVLQQLSLNPHVRGIRQVLNFEPSWPRNSHTGNLLDNPQFKEGFALLANHHLSFDLQLNPHQFLKAAELVAAFPAIPVIINHLGTPTLQDLQQRPQQYWDGMKALAACPNTFIKISMLCYISVTWDEEPVIVDTVKKIIALFGPHRCMFASNHPVDRNPSNKWPAARLLPAFRNLASHLSHEEQALLWRHTAHRAYEIV